MRVRKTTWISSALSGLLAGVVTVTSPEPALARPGAPVTLHPALFSVDETTPTTSQPMKDLIIMADDTRSSTGATETAGRKGLDDKGFGNRLMDRQGITPEARPAIMPFEARDTLRLQLAGKIDQWFAKTDSSGAVFHERHRYSRGTQAIGSAALGQAKMMTSSSFRSVLSGHWPYAGRASQIANTYCHSIETGRLQTHASAVSIRGLIMRQGPRHKVKMMGPGN